MPLVLLVGSSLYLDYEFRVLFVLMLMTDWPCILGREFVMSPLETGLDSIMYVVKCE